MIVYHLVTQDAGGFGMERQGRQGIALEVYLQCVYNTILYRTVKYQ